MKMTVILLITHLTFAAIGFAAAFYTLPIIIAPEAPAQSELEELSNASLYQAEFKKNRLDSDALHWGEGKVAIGPDVISFQGQLAPGPDYRLYLSKQYLETEEEFKKLKSTMVQVGNVNAFDHFVLQVPRGVNVSDYNAVIVWCESFGQFITSGQYQ